jgi:hypothetical protein
LKHFSAEETMKKSTTTSLTTAQSLGALLMSACDIMRNDKELNGDLERLPMPTWIMFVKFPDALLEKYATDGELEFTLPDVLKVRPISNQENVNEIIGKFGGADQLRNAVNQLQSLL